MLACPAVRNTIREGRIFQLNNTIVTHSRMGMVLLDNALVRLYRNGIISEDSMLSFCNDPEEINKLKMMV
jgi:twitching motility protein PilT